MSGHSKWANIKRKKEANDKERGKIFSKLARLITLAVAEGGGSPDPATNVKLRFAVERAKVANMPKDNIERAIDKAVGPGSVALQEIYYEAFAQGSVALIIHATTDNVNRTIAEIRVELARGGAKLASQGSVLYLFRKCASIAFDAGKNSEEDLYRFADSIDSFDIEADGPMTIIYFPFENIGRAGDLPEQMTAEAPAEIDFRPISTVEVDAERALQLEGLIERLEDLDDVQGVFANY